MGVRGLFDSLQPTLHIWIPRITKIITLESERILYLRGVVYYHAQHYQTCFSIDDTWYNYNDYYDPSKQNDYIIEIGDYEDLIKIDLVTRHGIIYWYF